MILTAFQKLVLKVLLAIYSKSLMTPGVATYEEDEALREELEEAIK